MPVSVMLATLTFIGLLSDGYVKGGGLMIVFEENTGLVMLKTWDWEEFDWVELDLFAGAYIDKENVTSLVCGLGQF